MPPAAGPRIFQERAALGVAGNAARRYHVTMGKLSENLELRIARRHGDDYDEVVVQQSEQARDCHDCESALKLGCEVFDWIIEADQRYRRDLYDRKRDHSQKIEDDLAFLIRRWHEKSIGILQWAQRQVDAGFDVAHFSDFQRRWEEAAAIVESLDEGRKDSPMSKPLIALRDQALHEHQHGETAEFI